MNFDKKDMQCAQTSKKEYLTTADDGFKSSPAFQTSVDLETSLGLCVAISGAGPTFISASHCFPHLCSTFAPPFLYFCTTSAPPLLYQSLTVQLYSLLNQALGNFRQEMHFARVGKLIGAARHFDWDGNNVTGPSPISIKSWKRGSGISISSSPQS